MRPALGCVVALAVAVPVVLFFVWVARQPVRDARAFEAALHPGMTLGDVAVEATRHGRYVGYALDAQNGGRISFAAGNATVGTDTAYGPEAIRALLDRKAGSLCVESAHFIFLGVLPVRPTVNITFGPDGRLKTIRRGHLD